MMSRSRSFSSATRNRRLATGMAFIASGRLDVCSVLRVTDGFQIELGLGPGISLRAASANDTTQAITSTRGFELHGTLGVGGRL